MAVRIWCGPSLITTRNPFPKESMGILLHVPSSPQAEQGWWKFKAQESTPQSVWNRVWALTLGDMAMETLTTVLLGPPESSLTVWWDNTDCKIESTPRCKFFSWRHDGLPGPVQRAFFFFLAQVFVKMKKEKEQIKDLNASHNNEK